MVAWMFFVTSSPRRLAHIAPCLIAVAATLATLLNIARAQESLPDHPPMLPTSTEQWINSGPLSYDALKGKGVVLWYFEETCPKCARKWPGILQLAQEYAEKPVLFVAVNSGTSRRGIESYVRKHEIDWPVIVDPERTFEAESGVPTISLQRIHTMRLIKPDGTFTYGYWNDWQKSLDIALVDASWNVKYDRLHPVLHPAVRRMEFGIYRPVAAAIKAGLNDESPELRKSAEFTRKYVDRLIQDQLQKSIAGENAQDPWVQYQALELVSSQFAPLALPAKADDRLKQLRADPAIQKESRAARAVDSNANMLRSADPQKRERAIINLERMQKTFAGTHAATRATELLAADTARPAQE